MFAFEGGQPMGMSVFLFKKSNLLLKREMKCLYFLAILMLCFGCDRSETVVDDLSVSPDKSGDVKTRSGSLSASMGGSGLTVSWGNPFGCGGSVSILHVKNLDTSEGVTCYPTSSSGSWFFNEFNTVGTYLIMASCDCGDHSETMTYFFSPNGETIVNPQDKKCKHDFSRIATYMPNQLYLSNGAGRVIFRFWLSGEVVLGMRATTYNEFTGSGPGGEVRYRMRPTVMSSYSELEFMLPSNSNEFHKYWEIRIYSTECFQDNSVVFKNSSCNNYLSFKFGFDPIVGEWGPTYDRPLDVRFTEVRQN